MGVGYDNYCTVYSTVMDSGVVTLELLEPLLSPTAAAKRGFGASNVPSENLGSLDLRIVSSLGQFSTALPCGIGRATASPCEASKLLCRIGSASRRALYGVRPSLSLSASHPDGMAGCVTCDAAPKLLRANLQYPVYSTRRGHAEIEIPWFAQSLRTFSPS